MKGEPASLEWNGEGHLSLYFEKVNAECDDPFYR